MAYTGNGQKFVGDDGIAYRATFGTEITTGVLPDDAIYVVTAVGGTSGFPAALPGGDGIAVGDILFVEDGVTITLGTGDKVMPLVRTKLCDLSSWSMQFSKEEIDVTTLCEDIKTYRTGKADMQGSINGLFVLGTTDDKDGFLRQFIDIVNQDKATNWTKYNQEESILFGLFYVNEKPGADRVLVAAPFQLFGMNLGGEMGAADSFSGNFRFASLSIPSTSIALNPTFIRSAI